MKTALVNDTTIGIYAIEVRVANGVVTLSGRLPSEALVARTIEIARAVPGVAEVRSDLIVGGAAPATASAVVLPLADRSSTTRISPAAWRSTSRPATSLRGRDVTADGRFIMIRRGVNGGKLRVVVNWTEELKQILASGGVR